MWARAGKCRWRRASARTFYSVDQTAPSPCSRSRSAVRSGSISLSALLPCAWACRGADAKVAAMTHAARPQSQSARKRWSGIGNGAGPSPFQRGADVTAEMVKTRARALGADLVGIADAAILNAFPPDPLWPQTPERISPYVKSVIVLVQHIPAGAFRCKSNVPVQYMDMLVLRKMDKVAFRLAEELEAAGHPAFVVPAQETEWSLKRASYGRLSTRHLGVEAGLGTLGLEVNILTPEYGPRLYLTGVLTELELDADRPMTEQVCIGESCSRCLHSCPGDAVLHFGIDKRGCAEHAQEFGFAQILKFSGAPWMRKRRVRRRKISSQWRDRGISSASGRGCWAAVAPS